VVNHNATTTKLTKEPTMISVSQLPNEDKYEAAAMVFKTRINAAWQHYREKSGEDSATLFVSTCDPQVQILAAKGKTSNGKPSGMSMDERAAQYVAQSPRYDMSQLILPEETREQILLASQILSLEKRVFDEWGLRSIQPFPRSALNFYGPPGTGKSMAAQAIASHLGCPIQMSSYAQIDSMYNAEGPKNLQAVFQAAEDQNALLYFDEADTLLSKRINNVSQASEHTINSMRSQLLICLEQFRGVVVFATNLVENYDQAFETRLRSIEFTLPDRACRRQIWAVHLPPQLPIDNDVNLDELADVDGLCGREIREAVVDAALQAASRNQPTVTRGDFLSAIDRVVKSRFTRTENVTVQELTVEEQEAVERVLKGKDRS